MFLKGGEVHVSCDVLATEVIEDLLPRGVLPPGREGAVQIPVELPSAKSAVVPKNRSRSDGDALLAELDRWKTRRRQAKASPVAKARGRNGSGRARGCGFNRHLTEGEDGFGHFAVAHLTRPRSHPPATTSCSRTIGRAAAKSPPKEWLEPFGGDGGIDEMLARAPVTAMFGTAISMMRRRKEEGVWRRIRTPAARLRDSCAPLAS